MDRPSENGFDVSSPWIIHHGRPDNCEIAGLEKSVSKGTSVGYAHAQLLHQSRGTKPKPFAKSRTRTGKIASIEAHSR